MLQPKRSKFRKQFRGKMRGKAQRGNKLSFGEFGLKAIGRGWVSARQIEAARKKITHVTKRSGKYWIRIFPAQPITSKPVGVKMGSGKGDIQGYVVTVLPGRIMFELGGVPAAMAKEALRKAGHKISIKTSIVEK
ncbi:50S ribosomal protein L16 [Patescibacteria group bacterium]|nr:50S ribosomal protein L16 [Patescibacteria group bacterium]MBU1966931.1 50S ribosomal protein L16 [Patescibacteria group bacterium]MBU2543721.1 50S ribosomal protein L16 [Patescibacteria group bacterium]